MNTMAVTFDEALAQAQGEKASGKAIEEAFDGFKGQNCSLITMIKAVREAYGVTFGSATDALERRHPSLEAFYGARSGVKEQMTSFRTFEELESFLREWTSFSRGGTYDAGGLVALLAACLDNLEARLLEEEFEDLKDRLTESQRAYLLLLADRVGERRLRSEVGRAE